MSKLIEQKKCIECGEELPPSKYEENGMTRKYCSQVCRIRHVYHNKFPNSRRYNNPSYNSMTKGAIKQRAYRIRKKSSKQQFPNEVNH